RLGTAFRERGEEAAQELHLLTLEVRAREKPAHALHEAPGPRPIEIAGFQRAALELLEKTREILAGRGLPRRGERRPERRRRGRELVAGELHGRREIERRIRGIRRDRDKSLTARELGVA